MLFFGMLLINVQTTCGGLALCHKKVSGYIFLRFKFTSQTLRKINGLGKFSSPSICLTLRTVIMNLFCVFHKTNI